MTASSQNMAFSDYVSRFTDRIVMYINTFNDNYNSSGVYLNNYAINIVDDQNNVHAVILDCGKIP